MSDKNNNELYELAEFYKEKIEPYTYTYKALFGIEIELNFTDCQFCHLIFGTVKNVPNSSLYKGIKGFENIMNFKITSPPSYKDVQKNYKSKKDALYCIPDLLNKPKIYMFNKNIVDCGKIKGLKKTDIEADFLLYKEIDGKKIHLFLKWSENDKKIVPCSLIKNNADTYLENQIELKKLIVI